jgi:hypothetical protein
MPKAIMAVYSNPADAAREDEYNSWYETTHVPEVLALPGFVGATRYRLADEQLGGESEHRYVAMYEIDADDVQATLNGLVEGFGAGKITMSDVIAPGPILVWEQVSERQQA